MNTSRQLSCSRFRIRLSERKFYQKVTDLYAIAFDYDKNGQRRPVCSSSKAEQKCTMPSNYRHSGGADRGAMDANKEHMGLTTWENVDGKILKADDSSQKLPEQRRNELFEHCVFIWIMPSCRPSANPHEHGGLGAADGFGVQRQQAADRAAKSANRQTPCGNGI